MFIFTLIGTYQKLNWLLKPDTESGIL